jgi:hypothetical protein
MDHGRVRQFGPVADVVAAYNQAVNGPQKQAA